MSIAREQREKFMDLPEELRKIPRWVCWAIEKRGEHSTIVPKDPKTGKDARKRDSETWGTFKQALEEYTRHAELYSGIGFLFRYKSSKCYVFQDEGGSIGLCDGTGLFWEG